MRLSTKMRFGSTPRWREEAAHRLQASRRQVAFAVAAAVDLPRPAGHHQGHFDIHLVGGDDQFAQALACASLSWSPANSPRAGSVVLRTRSGSSATRVLGGRGLTG